MTKSKCDAIMEAERLRTMAELQKLPDDQKEVAMDVWLAVQDAINGYIEQNKTALPEGLLPMIFRLMADEHKRLSVRFANELKP